jgi:hypothetical protein
MLTQIMMRLLGPLFFMLSVSLQAQILDFQGTDFEKADSMAALYPNHSLSDLRALAIKLTKPLSTQEEKFRSLYKWICNNIENDYGLYLKSTRRRQKFKNPEELKAWNRKFTQQVFKRLLNNKATVCSGYAYLLKELSLHAGLSCITINGYGRTAQANIGGTGIPNHSWNAIQLNNKWYLCDATWSSGAIDTEERKFVKRFNEVYFLADPSLFVRNHYPLDSIWMLMNNKPTLNEFLERPLTYSTIYKYDVGQLFPETFNIVAVKGKPVVFRFSKNDVAVEKVRVDSKISNTVNSIFPHLYRDQAGLYCIDHIFRMKGKYIVHILLNDDYAFTYAVTVQ